MWELGNKYFIKINLSICWKREIGLECICVCRKGECICRWVGVGVVCALGRVCIEVGAWM